MLNYIGKYLLLDNKRLYILLKIKKNAYFWYEGRCIFEAYPINTSAIIRQKGKKVCDVHYFLDSEDHKII